MDRLEVIASLVDTYKVYDVASDHGLLALKLTNHDVTASDISESSINKMKDNLNGTNVKIIKSDGLNNLDIDSDSTIVIAGVGCYTILKILKKDLSKLSDTLIIQANNNHDILRREICKLGYFIDREETIYINRWYTIIRFRKGHRKYNKLDYILGPNPKIEYVLFNLKLYKDAYKKIPKRYFLKRVKLNLIIKKMRNYK